MPYHDLFPRSALLSTKTEIDNKFLFSSKIEKENLPDGFFFFILEFCNLTKSASIVQTRIKKAIELSSYKDGVDKTDYFEKLIETINESLGAFTREGVDLWKNNFNAIIGLISNNEIILSQTGKMSGYLFRKNKILSILENSNDTPAHPLKTFSNITAGCLNVDDKIILANNHFFDKISLDRIRKIISKNSPKRTVAEVFQSFHLNFQPVNMIAIEMSSLSTLEQEKDEDVPETVFADQKIETFVAKSLKICWPVAKKFTRFILSAMQRIGIEIRKTFVFSKKYYESTIKPSSQKAMIKVANSNLKNKFDLSVIGSKLKVSEQRNIKINGFKRQSIINKRKTFRLPEISMLSNLVIFLLQKEQRKYVYSFFIIIFSVIILSNIGVKNKNNAEIKRVQQSALSFDKADALFRKAKDDYALGKPEAVSELSQALDLAIESKESPGDKDKAVALANDIQAILDKEIRGKRISEQATAFPFGQDITKITMIGADLYGLNPNGELYLFDTRNKESQLVGSVNNNGKSISLTSSESLNKLFISSDQQKLIGYDIASRAENLITLADQSDWEKAAAIGVFSTNIYSLDPASNMIWKHTQVDDGYSVGSKYFDNRKVSVQDCVDLAIDGNIYLLRTNGNIMKFSHNSLEQEFAATDIPKPNDKISNPSRIITSEDTNKIFILDKALHRIVQTDKSGAFSGQYLFNNIEIDDFAINAKLQKLWIVSKSQIYEMDL